MEPSPFYDTQVQHSQAGSAVVDGSDGICNAFAYYMAHTSSASRQIQGSHCMQFRHVDNT